MTIANILTKRNINILVTGASGYIGSHLCKILHDNISCRLSVLKNVRHPEYDCKENAHIYFDHSYFGVDVREFSTDIEYDVVVHLAGMISVEESNHKPDLYYDVNVNGTANILKIKSKHFIFASTAGAFNPTNPYAISKIIAEDLIKSSDTPYTIFRFFNVAGSNGEFGQIGPSTHLIRVLSEVAMGKRNQFSLYGNDYDTRDGTCVRDYIHVEDIGYSILKAIKNGPKNSQYECLGHGIGYSNKEVLDIFQEATNTKIPYTIAPRRQGDPAILIVESISDLSSKKYNIDDMCKSAYQYERTH